MNKRKVIVDVDVGIDDYMALLLLFHAEKLGEIKIEAIVCTDGNTKRENVCRNVVRLLETLNRTDVPVYRGAASALIPDKNRTGSVHGEDGFGDLTHDKEPDLSIIREKPAAIAVCDIILQNPGEISLICVGPLTNLALAIKLDERILDNMKDLWIMGGNYAAVGNTTSAAEFNFYQDPESVHIVLHSVTKPIYILTWETVIETNISRDWYDRVLGSQTKPELVLLTRAEMKFRQVAKRKTWIPCDAFLAAAFLDPEKHIVKKSEHHASIELHGSLTRGQVVLDHKKIHPHNCTIIEKVSDENFKELVSQL